MVKICTKCDIEIEDEEASFCKKCGSRLEDKYSSSGRITELVREIEATSFFLGFLDGRGLLEKGIKFLKTEEGELINEVKKRIVNKLEENGINLWEKNKRKI